MPHTSPLFFIRNFRSADSHSMYWISSPVKSFRVRRSRPFSCTWLCSGFPHLQKKKKKKQKRKICIQENDAVGWSIGRFLKSNIVNHMVEHVSLQSVNKIDMAVVSILYIQWLLCFREKNLWKEIDTLELAGWAALPLIKLYNFRQVTQLLSVDVSRQQNECNSSIVSLWKWNYLSHVNQCST